MAEKRFIPIEIDLDIKDARLTQEALVKDLGRVKNSILEIREENKQLNKEFRDTGKDTTLTLEQQVRRRKEISEEIAKNELQLKKLNKEQRNNQTALKSIDKEVGAYERLSTELITLRNKIKDVKASGGVVNPDDIKRAQSLDKELKDIDGSLGQFQRNVGNYQSALDGLLQGGFLDGVGGQLGSIKDLIGGIGQSGGFKQLASNIIGAINPLTLVTGALVGIGVEIGRITQEYVKLFNITAQVTGEVGEVNRRITSQAKALADTFGQDFQEVLFATNSFAKQMGVSFDEAFQVVSEGFLQGANAQGDFLDNLREYPIQLKQAGLSLEDVVELQIRANREGFFNDKLPDAIKEAKLSLEEFTKTQRDALAPLGETFVDQLEVDIASGEINTVEAILRIKDRVEEVGGSVQDFATITADVFKGAGEDAGGAAKVIDQVVGVLTENLEDLSIEGDVYLETQRKILESSLVLNQAESELAGTFAGLSGIFAGTGNTIRATLINSLNASIGKFENFIITAKAFGAGVRQLFSNLRNLNFETSAVDAFNQSYVNSIKTSLEAQKAAENSAKAQQDSLKQVNPAIIRTRAEQEKLNKELAKQAEIEAQIGERRKRNASDIQRQIKDLQDLLSATNDDSILGDAEIELNISKLEQQLDALKNKAADELTLEAAVTLDTLDLIPTQIKTEEEIKEIRNQADEEFFDEAGERREGYVDEQIQSAKDVAERQKNIRIQALTSALNIASSIVQGIADVSQNRTDAEISNLEEKYEREIALEEGNTERQAELRAELEEKKAKIERKAFERQKRLQIAEATIAYSLGLVNIFAAKSVTVYDGPILKALQAAVLTAQYISSIASISSAKFAKGTVLEGPSHENSGIQMFNRRTGAYFGEAEGGEPILTKKTSQNRKALGLLSAVNVDHGGDWLGGARPPESLLKDLRSYMFTGKGFSPSSIYRNPPRRIYQAGGITTPVGISQTGTQGAVTTAGATAIANAVLNALKYAKFQVSVEDIVDAIEEREVLIETTKTS